MKHMTTRAICLSLGLSFNALFGAPAAEIVPSPAELKAQGLADYYMVFNDVPKNRDLYLHTKRLLQQNPDEWVFSETLAVDDADNVLVDGKQVRYYGQGVGGYAPGEKVHYCLCLEDGTTLAEGSYVPRPLVRQSKQGSFSVEAELRAIAPVAMYFLRVKGLKDGEVYTFSSVSGNEQINEQKTYDSKDVMLYMPGVIGSSGGEAWVKITRHSRDYALIRLPWGDTIAKPLLKEIKTGVEAPEFKKYSS